MAFVLRLRTSFPASSSTSSSSLRRFTTFTYLSSRASFTKPGPPPLPASDQAEFDALQKAASGIGPAATPSFSTASRTVNQVSSDEEMHKDLRKGPRKDFEGEINPNTGERGGPKTDPFKAGDGDWSYAGRVTDF